MSSPAPRTETRLPEPAAGHGLSPALAVGRTRHGAFRLGLAAAAHLPLGTAYSAARALGRLRHRFLRNSLRVNADIVRALGATPGQVEGLARRASQLRASSKLEAFLLRETTDASCDA